MKKTIAFFAVLFLLQVGFAQTITKPVEKKSAIIISGGPSIPVGPFASKTSQDGGMAKTGYNINLNYLYEISRIGIVLHGMYANHATAMPDSFSAYGISMGPWKYSAITAGVMTSYDLGKSGKFDLRLLIGPAFVNSPEMTYPSEAGPAKIASMNATTFIGELGAGYRLQFSQSAFLYGGVDWIAMQPKFKDETLSPEPMEQKMSALNVNVGIGFRF